VRLELGVDPGSTGGVGETPSSAATCRPATISRRRSACRRRRGSAAACRRPATGRRSRSLDARTVEVEVEAARDGR
jgi:hypothetical protein